MERCHATQAATSALASVNLQLEFESLALKADLYQLFEALSSKNIA